MIKTKNFSPETDPKLLCTCGHSSCDQRSVDQATLNRLQVVRDKLGPLSVTSGGRCPHHPDEIRRTKPADHQKGKAVDVKCNGYNRGLIIAAGIKAGFNAIGVAKTFVHLGHRPDEERELVMWVYK